MIKIESYTVATMGDTVIAIVPDGGDIWAAVSDAAARVDVDIDFRHIDVIRVDILDDDEDD